MFAGLIAFFAGVWNGVKYLFNVLWTWTHNIWGWLLAIILAVFQGLQYITDGIVWLLNQIPQLGGLLSGHNDLSGYDLSVLALANYVFPLDQVVGALVVGGAAWIVACVYRVIKSWIPTLA